MTRKIAFNTTAAAVAIAALTAPALAQTTDSASDLRGNSPAVTEGGLANDVASQRTVRYGRADTRYGNGIAAFDANEIALEQEVFAALSGTKGAEFKSDAGEVFGTISEVRYNERGFPELVVDLVPDNVLDAERLVVTVQPDNVTLSDNEIILDLTVDEMIAKAQSEGVRDDAIAEITIF
ncbi:MAG: hypothetical protein AAGM84_09150 [Pseudomonadota bacterium]